MRLRSQWSVLVAIALTTSLMSLAASVPAGAAVAAPDSVQAGETILKSTTKLLSRFKNGDVAYGRVRLKQEETVPHYGWASLYVWCQNSSGSTVPCDLVELGADDLLHQYWLEGSGWRTLTSYFEAVEDYTGDMVLNTLHNCYGKADDQYRAFARDIRVTNRAGEQGSYHDVIGDTFYGWMC
jgi:hypothetical protein